ncbi:hypothetical protein GGR51DRAFT_554406 [Nemania sp. FL0031]|nr:hypothetical protein GGR51DRAFT_554406 [Nemania sp. FL0031]
MTVYPGADHFTLNQDGSLVVTDDEMGTRKILAMAEFPLLYTLSSQGPIIYLYFSTDLRPIYDIRGAYGNVWEPNTLVRLSGGSKYPDHNSDMYSEIESLAKSLIQNIILFESTASPSWLSLALGEALLSSSIGMIKWICYPTAAEYLLGFGNTPSPSSLYKNQHNLYTDAEKRGRLFSNVDSPHVFLEISHSTKVETQYLVFDVTGLRLGSTEGKTKPSDGDISYTLVPPDISSRIREPLAFLSHQRLVFFDIDRLICTWRLPLLHPTRPQRRIRGSDAGPMGIEQYYFLPGDWLTANETHLCNIMPDGTLLCPWNGDVATVQCSRLRK